MSTRCWITRETYNDNTNAYNGIYCHYDGYPEGVGTILKNHYNDSDKVKELVELGDISSLGERVKPINPANHTFEHPEEGTTVAYNRDRGEGKPKHSSMLPYEYFIDIRDILEQAIGAGDIDYVYIYEKGEWRCYDINAITKQITGLYKVM